MQWHCFHITRSAGFHSSPVLNRSLLPSLASKAVPSPLRLWGTVTNWKVLLNVAWFGTQGLEIPPLVKTTRLQGVELSTPTTAPVDMCLCIWAHAPDIAVRILQESKSVTKSELQYFWTQTINMFMYHLVYFIWCGLHCMCIYWLLWATIRVLLRELTTDSGQVSCFF